MASPDSPPWAAAASKDQLFVLLTGANSGVGLGIGQRLIDEFLASRPTSSHLILIPTTRSIAKSRDTVNALHDHLDHAAARHSPSRPAAARDRIHLLSLQLDLCDLRKIYAAADLLVHGRISDPSGRLPGSFAIPRLDVAIFNAGIGGWSGFNWLGLASQTLSVGIVQATTYPQFKDALPAAILDTQKLIGDSSPSGADAPPALAEVFTANVFGHYVLSHALLPILRRPASQDVDPARVIWTSTIDAEGQHLDIANDFQAARRMPPYESSKRITDLICLSSNLPSVRPAAASYFSDPSDSSSEAQAPRNPRFYLAHPGIVCTPIFPLNWFLYFWYWVTMSMSRWLGSPWHTVESYTGAAASSWLTLTSTDELEDRQAHLSKWGSACDPYGRVSTAKMSEVPDWGWQGQPGDDGTWEDDRDTKKSSGDELAFLRKSCGRKWDAQVLTPERREAFEEDGRACWTELERLRLAWEKALGREGN